MSLGTSREVRHHTMRYGVCTWTFGEHSLAGTAARLASLGYDGVELAGDLAQYNPAEVNAVLGEYGLDVLSLTPENETDLEERYDEARLERLVTLRSEMAGKLKVIPAGFNHTIPAVAVMFVLFTVLMYGGILLLQERRAGQLERTYLSPATFSAIVGGKWLSRLSLGMLQITILFIIGKLLFKVYLGNSLPALFCVSLFFCGTIAGMSMLLGSFIKKEEVLIVLNILLANLMSALGGCWFPLELIPPGVRKVSFIFPTGWTMDAFHKLIFFGYDFRSVLVNIAVLLGFTLVFLALAVKFFKIQRA